MSTFTTILSKLGPITKQVLGTYAPTALKYFGGPFGPIAADALQAVFGTKDPDALEKQMATVSPDNVVKLRQIEADLQAKMTELKISEEDLYLKDIQDARAMQVAVKSNTPAVLAYMVIGGFLLLATFEAVTMTFFPEQWSKVPPAAFGLLGTIIGYLLKAASGAETFYFGSSAGSQAKDQTLADLAKNGS